MGVAAGKRDLTLERGASYRLSMTWARDSGSVDGNGKPIPGAPYSLVGCRAHMQIRDKVDGPVLVSLTTVNGGIVLGTNGDLTTGKIAIYISPVQTQGITLKKAVYDLFVVYPNEVDSVRLLQGRVIIVPAVTSDGAGAP